MEATIINPWATPQHVCAAPKTKAQAGSERIKCPDCGKEMFTRNLQRHQSEFCPMRIQLCQECGRDTIGEICDRCDEGDAHVDEQMDRQTIDTFTEDSETEESETEDEEREEYYGL